MSLADCCPPAAAWWPLVRGLSDSLHLGMFLVNGSFSRTLSVGDSEPTCLVWKLSPPVQTFEKLKNCPRCLVEAHLWAFLASPLVLGFSILCCSCKRTYLDFFLCKVLVKGNLSWPSSYSPVPIFSSLALMWSHNTNIRFLVRSVNWLTL